MSTPEFDAIVVGSGAGGGACAWGLARKGLRVLVLEAGPAYSPAEDYRLHDNSWEQSHFPAKEDPKSFYTTAPLQKLDEARADLRSWNHLTGAMVKGNRRAAWGYRHVRGVGGSTLHFTGEAHRFNPRAMQMHSRFGVAADWPLEYAELEPYYNVAERIVGVAGSDKDERCPRSEPYPLSAHAISYASKQLKEGFNKIGLQTLPNSLAVLSSPRDGRPACNYCGQCNRGCPRLDKGSVDITFLFQATATGNCTVRSRCEVTHLEAGPHDRITAVLYRDTKGALHRVSAPRIVIAAGAVQTPRLLLNSAGLHAQDGLANESGQVGKHFMETVSWVSTGLFSRPLGSHRGLPADMICWDFNAPDAIPDLVGGCRFSTGTAEVDLAGPINYAKRVVGGWGRKHKNAMRRDFGRAASVVAVGESLPNEGSFVGLDPEVRDRFGLPLPRIHSQITDAQIRLLGFMAGKCRAVLDAAGSAKIIEEYGSYDAFNSTHVFGTCRMGADPAHSVVNKECRSHRWRNLYIVDASVFPSSGGGESPSLTIEALALRAANIIAGSA